MNISQTLQQLRDDFKSWVTNNLIALNNKIEEKTIPIDSELSSTSTNPVQNKAIASEIDDINSRVGDKSVATQISNAIAKQPHFSGDYNDLTNAPDIAEDCSGNMVIADESGNIILKADSDGIHTTALTLDGKAAATESYVNNAIDNIEIPEVDFTGYATEDYVDDKVADLVNSAPEALDTLGELATALENHADAYDALLEVVGGKTTHDDLENLKAEISESIVSETEELHIVDDAGNIVASIDEHGITTTVVTAQTMIVNGDNVEEHIDNTDIHVSSVEKNAWNAKSNFSGSYNDLTDKPDEVDLSGYATEEYVTETISNIEFPETDLTNYYDKEEVDAAIEAAKDELCESIVSESEEWKVVDSNGNIIATIDSNGFETTVVTAQNIIVNGVNMETKLTELEDYIANQITAFLTSSS